MPRPGHSRIRIDQVGNVVVIFIAMEKDRRDVDLPHSEIIQVDPALCIFRLRTVFGKPVYVDVSRPVLQTKSPDRFNGLPVEVLRSLIDGYVIAENIPVGFSKIILVAPVYNMRGVGRLNAKGQISPPVRITKGLGRKLGSYLPGLAQKKFFKLIKLVICKADIHFFGTFFKYVFHINSPYFLFSTAPYIS